MTTIDKQSLRRRKIEPKIKERIAWIIIVFIQFIAILSLYSFSSSTANDQQQHQQLSFHGGNPLQAQSGSCYCNSQPYCLCTPSLAIDAILVSSSNPAQIYLVQRKDTNTLATMGGFVQVGETVENALQRELKEETNGGLGMKEKEKLFGIYSDPRRDGRRHTASVVYVVTVQEKQHEQSFPTNEEQGEVQNHVIMKGGDDVKEIITMDLEDVRMNPNLFFSDHWVILMDYYEKWVLSNQGEELGEEYVHDESNNKDEGESFLRQKMKLATTTGAKSNNLPLGEGDNVVRSMCFPN
mmetsp:Transcript_31760/g.46541  ORF Transcript_31760/g.46541 Transcript_31760/m.46541 type:complete len:296 (+) Transcript_31760:164-1051(+)